jgi:ABC-2 type transport system permease protein
VKRPDWFVIARREFIERVRSVWFVIVTIIGPIGMIGAMVIPALLAGRTGREGVRIQIVDHTGKLGPALVEALGAGDNHWKVEEVPPETPEATLLDRIRRDELDGFLVLPSDTSDGGEVVYSGDNATNQGVSITLQTRVFATVIGARATEAGVPATKVAKLLGPVNLDMRHTTGEAGGGSGTAAFIIGYAVMFILYISILLYAVNVLRSVVQEKTNRVAEVMVAAAKPRALMLGKILGVGSVGVLQLAIWVVVSVLLMHFRGQILGIFGIAAAGWEVPAFGIADAAVILGFFLFGYFFYAALYAGIGAMVNSDQEAQQVQTPVTMLLIIPVLCATTISNDPRGGVAQILTMVPFSSPVLMPMRWLLGGATGAEVLVSLAILALSIYLAAELAARIYRVGILMYGKRPTLRELWHWIRY